MNKVDDVLKSDRDACWNDCLDSVTEKLMGVFK